MYAITQEMKVAEVFGSYPTTHAIFKKFGFGALTNPILRNTFGRITSIEKGCKLHNVNLDRFLLALNDALKQPANSEAVSPPAQVPPMAKSKCSPEELVQINNILNTNIRTITAQ